MSDVSEYPARQNRIRDRLDTYFSAASVGFRAYRECGGRMARMRKLGALSDAELAARGLTRDGIPAFVFRDLFDL